MLDRMLAEQILPHAKRHEAHDVSEYLQTGAPREAFSLLHDTLDPLFRLFASRPTKEERELLKRHEGEGVLCMTFDNFILFAQAFGLQEHQFSTDLSADFTLHELATIFVDVHPVQRVDRPGGIAFDEFAQCLLHMTLLSSDVLDAPLETRKRTVSSSRYFRSRSRSASRSRTDSAAKKMANDSAGGMRKRSESTPRPEQTEHVKENIFRFVLHITATALENQTATSPEIAETPKFRRAVTELQRVTQTILQGQGGEVAAAAARATQEAELQQTAAVQKGKINASTFMSTFMARRNDEPKAKGTEKAPRQEKAPSGDRSALAPKKKMSFLQTTFGSQRGQKNVSSKPGAKKKMSFFVRSTAPNSSTTASPEAAPLQDEEESYRDQLVAIYEEHAPKKLRTIDALLRKYEGREQDLVRIVKRKYKVK